MEARSLSIGTFIEDLSSSAPAPGGGGASALIAAVGTSLAHMVGALTVGKKKYADVEADIIALNEKMSSLTQKLLFLMDEDERVFLPLSKAYGMPKSTPEEIEEKNRVMEAALKDAAEVPMGLMRVCAEAIDMLKDYAAKGTAIAISDVGVGAAALRAGLMGASLNVFINTKSMKDRDHAEKLNDEANLLIAEYAEKAEEIFYDVRDRF